MYVALGVYLLVPLPLPLWRHMAAAALRWLPGGTEAHSFGRLRVHLCVHVVLFALATDTPVINSHSQTLSTDAAEGFTRFPLNPVARVHYVGAVFFLRQTACRFGPCIACFAFDRCCACRLVPKGEVWLWRWSSNPEKPRGRQLGADSCAFCIVSRGCPQSGATPNTYVCGVVCCVSCFVVLHTHTVTHAE